MADRLSSLDDDYQSGDLSQYPEALDTSDDFYEAKNNAETYLTQSITFNGSYLVVNDTSAFPDKGLLRVGEELLYYGEKGTGIFKSLIRGFAGSQQNAWSIGTEITNGVMAEHHNAVKDALLNIQDFLGTLDDPVEGSFNYRLSVLERRFLAPKSLFRAYPRAGMSPLTVKFQNFSTTEAIRFLWDFGDGGASTDNSPTHTYQSEGNFSVTLRLVTSSGGQSITQKKDYVIVNDDRGIGFMYVTPEMGDTATTFNFVDQTDGDVVLRYWNFGDGNKLTIDDPDIHTASHIYTEAGVYGPTLLVIFSDQRLLRVTLDESIVVTE